MMVMSQVASTFILAAARSAEGIGIPRWFRLR